MRIAVWQARGRGEPVAVEGTGPWSISAAGVRAVDEAQAPLDGAVLLPGASEGLALLVTPEPLEGRLARNGQPVAAGIEVLRHADRLELADLRVWVSAAAVPVEAAYDPAIHGDEAFCARTRSRLRAGEPIVICPGTESTPCGALYKAEAWALGRRCHHCGRAPGAPAWKPPVLEKETYRDLVRLAIDSRPVD
ncbi:MAG: hypothetical protein NUV77_01610 [Thermoguttaceae bacterium]|jgi:hypothetical protein|nr:hypothetical protein [Thermoguttaceae bacterium]